MAIVSVEESWERESSQDHLWHRTYKRRFKVVTDGPYNGPVAVRQALPVQIGYPYAFFNGSTRLEFDFSVFCNRIDVRCISADGSQWECDVSYDHYSPAVFPQNPIQWPIKVSWGTVKFERPLAYDVDGDAVLNSAGQFFDPPETFDDSRTTLRIERNEPTFLPAVADSFKDAINQDAFFGGDPGTWKVADITADLQFNVDSGTPDGFFYTVTYSFEYRAEGWEVAVLDQGLMVFDISGNLVKATDADGSEVNSPILLDGNGKALASGDQPVFLTFRAYEKVTFGQLNLSPTGAPGQGS